MNTDHRSGSLKTRSEASSMQTASCKTSSAWRRAQISKLRAEQAQRAADAAIKHAQRVAEDAVEQARADAQRAADQAEIDDLEARMLDEETESEKLTSRSVYVRRSEPPTRPAIPEIEPRQAADPDVDDLQRRTRGWVENLPSGVNLPPRENAPQLPRVALEKFSGSALEWPRWSALFKTLVHNNQSLTDTERMVHLQSCLTGDAREAVRGLLCNGSLYDEAMKELELQFGDPATVVEGTLTSVMQHPAVKPNDLGALTRLSRALHAAVSVLTTMEFQGDLTATTNLRQVVAKLPTSLAWQWGQRELELLPRVPTLADLDLWLKGVVLAGRRALPGLDKLEPEAAQRRPSVSSLPRTRDQQKPIAAPWRTTLATTSETEDECKLCTAGAHQLSRCPALLAMSPEERFQLVRDGRRCFRCLSDLHWARKCRNKTVCGENGCKGKHHRLLHMTAPAPTRPEQPADAVTDRPRRVLTTVGQMAARTTALLQVVPVRLHGAAGIYRDTHALLDSGADTSLCVETVARELSITGPREDLRLSNVESSGESKPSMKITLQVSPLSPDGEAGTVTVPEVFTVPRLNVRPPTVDWSQRRQWTHLADIEVPDTNNKPVELLLGANVLEAVLQREARVGKPGQPAAIKTHFGWCLTGNVTTLLPVGTREVMHVARSPSAEDELGAIMQDWWTTEAFGTAYNMSQPYSQEDREAEKMMEKTTQWRGDRYETGLLWRSEDVKLPDNYKMAARRLETTEKALIRAPHKAKAYRETIEDYVSNGYAKKVEASGEQREDRCWYLPHHAVTNPNKPGKFRVVFDAAARYLGVSLNEQLLTGPDLLKTVPGVLLRFRQESVALTADIEKMFLQIAVKSEDQPSLRFLWRDLDSTRPPDIYQMDRVIFGARSSPASASFVLNRTAEEKSSNTAAGHAAAATVKGNFYMDDLATSEVNSSAALQTAAEVTALVSRGGFRLRKWLSNCKRVLIAIPAEERALSVGDLSAPLPAEKVLGVTWDAQEDVLHISVPAAPSVKATKREVLRVVASIFDPLGLASPFILIAKLLLQELWSSGRGWDDNLPDGERDKWAAWLADLPSLSDVRVPRWYGAQEEAAIKRQLHIFCDASESAFGAVAYLRQIYKNGYIHCALVMSKCRVAPLKKLSIVRLETQAAVLAVRLAQSIKGELTLEVHDTLYWSDSQVVLSYIANDSKRFHTFIANRVTEIRDTSQPSQWRHIPGESNPADDCSRGMTASALTSDSRWINGPDFLWQSEDSWPDDCERRRVDGSDPEAKTVLATRARSQAPQRLLPDPTRFSSWTRLKRTVGWIRRFLNNFAVVHAPSRHQFTRLSGPLSTEEIRNAETAIIRQTQRMAFGQEITALEGGATVSGGSRLLPLSPQLDRDGLLRVGGRLRNAPLPEESRHPVVLPPDSRVAALIITSTHVKLMHVGADHVLNDLRRKYWIPRGRALVRKTVHDCPVCARRRASPCLPRMADLPAARFDTRYPFSSVGIDYFGPLLIKTGRRSTAKRYCLLVTCLASRAVHLEISGSLTTDSFLLAFSRYVARRGRPSRVFSDNGTNLRAGEKELRKLLREWNQHVISDHLSQDQIQWHFNPPASSDMGGVWEAMIATVKRALRAVLGNLLVTEEVLQTVVAEAEAVVNGRPLTHVSTEADSLEALTPSHLLLGRPTIRLPPGLADDCNSCSRRIWRQSQAIANQFWRRWLREYVPTLACRRKWTKDTRNLVPGDLILLAEDDLPRGHWPLGRVIEVYPGPDGRVRSARLRVRGGTVHRPARKICVLEEAAAL